MSQQKTMVINGREYDVVTGLPIQKIQSTQQAPTPQQKRAHQKAQASYAMHGKTQRSTTLNRAFVKKKPASQKATQAAPQPIIVSTPMSKTPTTQPSIQKRTQRRIDGMRPVAQGSAARANAALARANAHKKGVQLQPVQSTPVVSITPAAQTQEKVMAHPIVERVHQKHAAKKAPTPQKAPLPASVLKQAVITEALDNAPKHHAKQHKQPSKRGKLLSIVSGFAALVLFAGYLTYLNVPNLSVRVAAAQAGIDASYPSYQPDGYKLNGPVAFSDGEVRMQFAAKTGSNDFTLKQSRSSWDSNALLENYVKEKSHDSYTTSQERGITVYSFDGNAAWVSGGILYTIEGDTQLSPDQIRKIATSV